MYSIEKKFWSQNKLVAGIDEAGRGPLAGPVVSASVVFEENFTTNYNINDSKKLSPKLRKELYDVICEKSLAYGISFVDNDEIDEINILNATYKAMNKSLLKLTSKPNHLLIDGNRFKLLFNNNYTYDLIVKGDSKSISIAAASILAKVERDMYMDSIDLEFPHYGFSKHKGYATKQHFEAIKKYGICKYHRKSFLKKFFNSQLSLNI